LIETGEVERAAQLLRSARRRFEAQHSAPYGFKSGYYLARIALQRDRAAWPELLGWMQQALDTDRGYDLLYLLAFAGEALASAGFADGAARLFAGADSAPQADTYLRAVVNTCRDRAGVAEAASGAAPEVLARVLAGTRDVQDAAQRLRRD
jgi:hypothetical protein